jgi:hypothetical protein
MLVSIWRCIRLGNWLGLCPRLKQGAVCAALSGAAADAGALHVGDGYRGWAGLWRRRPTRSHGWLVAGWARDHGAARTLRSHHKDDSHRPPAGALPRTRTAPSPYAWRGNGGEGEGGGRCGGGGGGEGEGADSTHEAAAAARRQPKPPTRRRLLCVLCMSARLPRRQSARLPSRCRRTAPPPPHRPARPKLASQMEQAYVVAKDQSLVVGS